MFTELRKYSIAENYSILHFRKIVHNFENMEMGFYGLLKWYLSDKSFNLKIFLLLIFNLNVHPQSGIYIHVYNIS